MTLITRNERTSLAINLYHEHDVKASQWRASWQTSLGGVISMSVLTIVILLMKLTTATALEAIIVTQALRTLWLFRKAVRASREAQDLFGGDVVTVIKS